jgi:hypothetical protein
MIRSSGQLSTEERTIPPPFVSPQQTQRYVLEPHPHFSFTDSMLVHERPLESRRAGVSARDSVGESLQRSESPARAPASGPDSPPDGPPDGSLANNPTGPSASTSASPPEKLCHRACDGSPDRRPCDDGSPDCRDAGAVGA